MTGPTMLAALEADVPAGGFTTYDVEQRSPLWASLRVGLLTGSAAPAMMQARKKGSGELKKRADLRDRLVTERLTGLPSDRAFRQTASMTHGVETEPDAVGAYEAATGLPVLRVGFVRHLTLMAGCSVDGYVGEWEGVIEAKCPDSTTHLTYWQDDVVREEYYFQLVHAMWLTGAQWGDFVSFDPRFQAPLQLFVKRLHRADVDMAAYELMVRTFLGEVDTAVEALQRRAAALAVAP